MQYKFNGLCHDVLHDLTGLNTRQLVLQNIDYVKQILLLTLELILNDIQADNIVLKVG